MKLLKNEKGLALPTVLMVMLVMTLLGTALWHYSMNGIQQASRNQKKMQAYYIARAGADAIAQHIIERPQAALQLQTATSPSNLATRNVGDGYFEAYVRLDPANANIVQVISRGFSDNGSDNATSQVTLNVLRQQSNIQVFHQAVAQTSNQTLDLTKMSVIGDVSSAGSIETNPRRFAGTTYPDTSTSYPAATLPVLPAGTVTVSGNDTIVQPNYSYLNITSGSNGDIIFNTGVAGTTSQVIVHTLDAGRNIILNGNGKLELFVTSSAVVQTGSKRTVNRAGNESNLVVYLMDNTSLTLKANVEFYGYIYGPNATLNMQSGLTTISGGIVVGSLRKSDGTGVPIGNIIHVPPPSGANILSSVFGYIRGYWNN